MAYDEKDNGADRIDPVTGRLILSNRESSNNPKKE